MQNKDDEGLLDDEKFYTFLQKITGFIWTYAITNPGVNALRTPVYAEMVNIVNDKPVEFSKYKFDADTIRSMFDNFSFNNARPYKSSYLLQECIELLIIKQTFIIFILHKIYGYKICPHSIRSIVQYKKFLCPFERY